MFQNTMFLVNNEVPSINPKEILRSVYLKKNEIFSRRNHTITLNRLMSMDNFKFVRVKFSDSDTTAAGYLDVTILMTPMPKHTFRAEMDLVTKSNNFMGPRMNVSLLDRNTFHGAEILKLNLAGSFEAQLNGTEKNRYSYSWNPQLDLTFPRFITPFNIPPDTKYLHSKNKLFAFIQLSEKSGLFRHENFPIRLQLQMESKYHEQNTN